MADGVLDVADAVEDGVDVLVGVAEDVDERREPLDLAEEARVAHDVAEAPEAAHALEEDRLREEVRVGDDHVVGEAVLRAAVGDLFFFF